MRAVLRILPAAVEPDPACVRDRLGIGRDREPTATVSGLVARAGELLHRHAHPAAMMEQVTPVDFARIYAGEGKNLSPAPLETVWPRAERLALYAATLGEEVSREIAALFEVGDYALGYVLDAMASCAADRLSTVLAKRYVAALVAKGDVAADRRALDYSPGYCGWDITGQRALFARLRPVEIGVSINESCLMRPLKSVSGVIAVGPASIHRLEPAYACCATCGDRNCHARGDAPIAAGD